MMKRLYYAIGLCAALLATGCNETLEETYEEFAGDGMIQYLGKCSDVEVNPGWERLQVVWKHNIDADVEKVKIAWTSDAESGEMFVEPLALGSKDLMDTVYIPDLSDAMYTVRVSNLSKDGRESLVEEKYGRPYSFVHEDLRSFTRGIATYSRMGDKLMVTLDQDNENVKKMVLSFTGMDGQEHTWDMKAHMKDSLSYSMWGGIYVIDLGADNMFLLPDEEGVAINWNQPIKVKRAGKLQDCVDEIDFEDVVLNMNERLWSTEFSKLMVNQFGTDWESKVNDIEEVEIDYDMNSMLDLMYLPNLKKVVLGKNRYILDIKGDRNEPSYAERFKSSTNEYIGLMTLGFLHATRPGFIVERYNNHYFYGIDDMGYPYIDSYKRVGKLAADFNIVEKGCMNLDAKPNYVPLDTTGWEMTCSDTTVNGYAETGAANLLFDGLRHFVIDYYGSLYEYDDEAYLQPEQTLGASVVEVTYDMKTPQVVQGFKAGQPTFDNRGDTDFLLSNLVVEFSTDGLTWTDATRTDGSVTIGNSPGEETFIPVPKELQTPVRYIRLTMSNRNVGDVSGEGLFNLRLGKFIPCRVE